tara:strand:- start:1346 stop:2698 length:1353 start_codon:yes stop_codon:yes gene_type:complete
MADEIRPTPRNPLFGLFSDFVNVPLDYMSDPRRTQQMQGIASFIRGTGVPSTLENLSYDPSGRGLFTGAGGLGGTTRMRPEAIEAALTLAPGVGPAARLAGRGIMATGRTLGPTAAGMTERYMQRQGMMPSLDVYHGTPHTLPPTKRNPLGEFDASKIGTGEGAQAYGHGIYTAEAPAVAIEYKKALSNPEVVLKDGTRISNPTTGSPEDVAKAWLEEAYLSGDKTPFDTAIKKVSMLRNSANSPKQFDGALDVLNNWKKSGASVDLGGNLYKADLPDAMIPKMLDWDKPLSQQHLNVQAALKGIEAKFPEIPDFNLRKWMDTDPLASTFHNVLNRDLKVDPALIASTLKERGIPGIKYLDEASRGVSQKYVVNIPEFGGYDFSTLKEAKAFIKSNPQYKTELIEPKKTTSNFVTFPGEEQNLRILQRNAEVASPMYTDPFGNTIADTTR